MKYRYLGETNILVSEVSCGGIPIQKLNQEEAFKLVDALEEVVDALQNIDNFEQVNDSDEIEGTENTDYTEEDPKKEDGGLIQNTL